MIEKLDLSNRLLNLELKDRAVDTNGNHGKISETDGILLCIFASRCFGEQVRKIGQMQILDFTRTGVPLQELIRGVNV